MEDIQNDIGPEGQEGGEGSAKGGAKLIRAGSEAKAGENPMRDSHGDGDDEGAGSGPVRAAAGPVLRAGRRAVEGVATGRQAAEGAEALRRQVAEGADVLRQQAVEAAAAAATAIDEAGDGAGADVLREWVNCAQRAYIRNTGALGELLDCRTPDGLLRWQSNLLNETLSDLADTNARILRLLSHKKV